MILRSEISTQKLLLFFLPLIVLAIFFVVWQGLFWAVLLTFLLFTWILSYHPEWGFYGMALLGPMAEWELSFAHYPALFQDSPRFLSVNAPVIDFWILLVGLGFAWQWLRNWLEDRPHPVIFPFFILYAVFLLSALVSLSHLPILEVVSGVKYLVRYLLFFYLGYLVLGVNVCTDSVVWKRGLRLFAFVGIFGAMLGLISLVSGSWHQGGFYRAVPMAIFGWAPFGFQHILLAEVLVATLPILLFLWHTEVQRLQKRWYGYSIFLVTAVALLTLSRSAWFVLGVSTLLFVLMIVSNSFFSELRGQARYALASILALKKKNLRLIFKVKEYSWIALILLPFIVYVSVFVFFHPSVASSDDARNHLTGVAMSLFRESPFVGQGVGSFLSRLAEVDLFRLEFGAPLEAHGVAQKLLAEQGLFGLVTFVLLLLGMLSALFWAYQKNRENSEKSLPYLLGFFLVFMPALFQFFSTHYYASTMWIPIMLGVSSLRFLRPVPPRGFLAKGERKIIKTDI